MSDRIDTFSEREGLKPLPVAYKLGELPYDVRNEIKYILEENINNRFHLSATTGARADWPKIFKDFYVRNLKLPLETFHPDSTRQNLFNLISSGPYNHVIDVLEYFINHHALINHPFVGEVSDLFEREQVAYMLIDGNNYNKLFAPRASKEEGIAYSRALYSLEINSFRGARKNLVEAGAYLTKREYSKSIRESIHAVESIVRVLTGNKTIDLSDGLKELTKKYIHRALGDGFIKLYAFASNEDGVRHSSIEGIESIDEETAFYFLGSCASFITYLINKANKANFIVTL